MAYDPYANLIAAARKVRDELEATTDADKLRKRRLILSSVLSVAIRNAERDHNRREEAA